MSNILQTIVAHKADEIAAAKKLRPQSWLINQAAYQLPTVSAAKRIRENAAPAVITEFKRRSPSKGWIKEGAEIAQIVPGYCQQEAAAISVLTDEHFFGGTLNDLQQASQLVTCPLLRKDFTIDAYQLHEAKAYGADMVLLIAAILSPAQVQELAAEAVSIGLEVLLELHAEEEIKHVCTEATMVGINNRNLKNFAVDLDHSIHMAAMLPKEKIRIAESGIHSAEAAVYLRQQGFDGFLIGEYFMKHASPPIAFAEFKKQYQQLILKDE